MEYLKLFRNHNEYEQYISGETAVLPNVSHCIDEAEMHYNPWVEPPYQGFCKLTLNNGEVVELEGSGELTDTTTSKYLSDCVSAEIGTLCTSIGNSAFRLCDGLKSITIGNSVTSIGSGAFVDCWSLTSVTIGSGVTSIDTIAFRGCDSLTSITSLATTAPTIQSNTFQGVKTSGTLTVPSGSSGYDVWMGSDDYYLGKYGWTKVEQ